MRSSDIGELDRIFDDKQKELEREEFVLWMAKFYGCISSCYDWDTSNWIDKRDLIKKVRLL